MTTAESPPPAAARPRGPARCAIRGDLLDLVADPGLQSGPTTPALRYRPDHWLLVEEGRILGAEPAARPPGEDWERHDQAGQLVMPGFVDLHVHLPQLDVIASYGEGLLDWLAGYTYPAEARYADAQVARAGAAVFLDALLANGTTSAMVFPTVHAVAAEALFEAALARGMRVIAGKVMMDRHAPDGLRDEGEACRRDCEALIARWHGRGRLAYALTPRFAASSTPGQLALAGELHRAHPGTYVQTHWAETRAEVAWVARLHPEARSYLDVYERAGLLGERTVLAHGIWCDREDRARLSHHRALIAHCPSSNLFLGSGLFDWRAAAADGVRVGLATDVGGGTSLSMLRTLADAYRVQSLQGLRPCAWSLLHAATRGAAEALGLGHELGTLEPGRIADVVAWHQAVGPVARHRDALARDLHERVFAWLMLGDERNVAGTWVAGRLRFRGSPA